MYIGFVPDVFSQMIVGWQTSRRLYADLALDALMMALHPREAAGQGTSGLIDHSDHGVQYRSIRYTERLDSSGAVASVVSKSDAYDNAMAEALNSLFKAEVVCRRKAWNSASALGVAVLEWVHWYNTTRVHSAIGYITPSEAEAAYWAAQRATTPVSAVPGP